MIGDNVRQALRDQVEQHAHPVLSLYLDVNPANPDNSKKAFVLRAAEALRALSLDKEYIDKVTTKLAEEFVIAKGRSLVVFAGSDVDELFNAYYLQTPLPFLGASNGVVANWGEPFVAPLVFALDQKQRYAVIYVSTDRVRVFEVFLGQIAELSDYVRLVDTEDWQPYRNARRSPAAGVGVAARGGADVDAYRARLEEASVRLYRAMLPEVEGAIVAAEVDRVILVGLPGATGPFRDVMSAGMQRRVVGSVPPPANPDGPPRDWLPLVTDLMASVEAEHQGALLDRIRESGVWGMQQTLSLLQEHRIQTLVVPWNLDQRVQRDQDGRVSVAGPADRELEPGETSEDVALLEVLPGLVEQSGARLEFVEGANEVRLNDEFGGMAGVTRW
jgi:hypothetical protein